MIIGISESKALTKHISCKFKCKCDGVKCNSKQNWNNDKCWCECKNQKEHHCTKKIIFGILLHTCCCENGKYLATIIDDSVTTCDEVINTTKTVPTNFS